MRGRRFVITFDGLVRFFFILLVAQPPVSSVGISRCRLSSVSSGTSPFVGQKSPRDRSFTQPVYTSVMEAYDAFLGLLDECRQRACRPQSEADLARKHDSAFLKARRIA